MFKKLKLSKNIKMIVSDFDGVFTDGSIYISDDFKTSKKLNFKDIMGVSCLLKNGYKIALISGEVSAAAQFFSNKFDTIEEHLGVRIKLPVLKEIMDKNNLSPDEVIYIGDDVNDIECLNYVKYPVTVPNANFQVKKIKNINITANYGGDGAFREVADNLLSMR